MGTLDGLFDPASSTIPLYEGIIVGTPETTLDQLEVIVPAFDPQLTHGPAPWSARIDDDGSPVLPSDGDRCAVGFAETDHPGTPEVWILTWWPSD